jgi:hypothetical protein
MRRIFGLASRQLRSSSAAIGTNFVKEQCLQHVGYYSRISWQISERTRPLSGKVFERLPAQGMNKSTKLAQRAHLGLPGPTSKQIRSF